jgi:hypothetical protein
LSRLERSHSKPSSRQRLRNLRSEPERAFDGHEGVREAWHESFPLNPK